MADARYIARRARRVALLLAFLAGVGIMVYPFVSNYIYQQRANRQLAELSTAVDAGSPEDYAAEIAAAQEYNKELVGQTVPDVFAIREGTTDKEYESYLNVRGDQVMGSVEIPVINVHLPIYHYSTEETLLKGCGHIFGSSLPVGGDSSHAVITAHRGLPAAKLFTDLDQLREGDQFYIKVLDQTLAYEVDHIEVVEPQETRSLAIKRGEDLVTLVTCTPYGVNTDRLLVRGHRVPYTPGDEGRVVAPHPSALLRVLLELACVAAGVAAAIGVRVLWGRLRSAGEERGTAGDGAGADAGGRRGARAEHGVQGAHRSARVKELQAHLGVDEEQPDEGRSSEHQPGAGRQPGEGLSGERQPSAGRRSGEGRHSRGAR